jgi:hypothetical protein
MVDARLGDIARAMNDELPKLQAAIDKLKRLSGKVAGDDV